jgi:hypothetical protein
MFCAMATVIDRCKTEGVVDVFQVVKALRLQKPGAVPTLVREGYHAAVDDGISSSQDNYKTVYESTLHFLDSFNTYANFKNV